MIRYLHYFHLDLDQGFDLDCLNSLFELEPNNEELYIQRANIYSKKDQHQKAIETFKEALKIAEDCSEIHSLIGMEYLFMDQYEAAKTHFIKCVDLDIEDYSSLYNIIYCFDFLDWRRSFHFSLFVYDLLYFQIFIQRGT